MYEVGFYFSGSIEPPKYLYWLSKLGRAVTDSSEERTGPQMEPVECVSHWCVML